VSCEEAANIAAQFGEGHGVQTNTATVTFHPSYSGERKGDSVRVWAVLLRRSPKYWVMVRASDGKVIAYTVPAAR